MVEIKIRRIKSKIENEKKRKKDVKLRTNIKPIKYILKKKMMILGLKQDRESER